MVQPEVAATALGDEILAKQGFLSRILACAPESLIGKRIHKASSPEAMQVLQQYKDRMLSIMEMPYPLVPDTRNELEPRVVSFSAEAEQLFREFGDEVEKAMAPGGEYESIRAFASKLPEHAARLAAAIAGYRDLTVTKLSRDDFARGIFIAAYYAAEAKRISGSSWADPDILLAQKLLDWLLREWAKPTVSARDIYTYGPSAIRNRETTLSLAKILVDHGWLKPHKTRRHDAREWQISQRIRPMSIRDFLARLSTQPSPPIASIAPIELENTFEAPTLDAPRNGKGVVPLDTTRDIIQFENGAPFHWDIESRSAAELGKGKEAVGARAYAEHPTTEILCVSYARSNGPIETWVPGQPIPEVVLAAAADPSCPWVAHNAAFERAMLECKLIPLHGWPMVPVDRHVCTMALALAHAYPGSLDGVAKILGLVNQKDVAREKIVRVMWKPRKPRRDEDPNKIYWEDSPELRVELYAHNKQDVAIERELHQHPKLPALPASEQDTWVLDAEINDRGVHIDAPLATAASRLATQALADLNERMRHETDGAVDKASKTNQLKTWLSLQGVKLPRRQKKHKSGLQWEDCLEAEDIEKLLAGDLPHPGVRTVLEIRLQAAQSAASKIDRMLRTRCADGRMRNLYQDLRCCHRAMVRRRLSTAEPETARAAEDRRSHRQSDRNGVGRRLRRHQG